MADRVERACRLCGSYQHHEDFCTDIRCVCGHTLSAHYFTTRACSVSGCEYPHHVFEAR